MKEKFLYAVIFAAFVGISCQSVPPESSAAPAPPPSSTPAAPSPAPQTGSQTTQPQAPIRNPETPAEAPTTFVGRLDMFGAQDYTVEGGDTLSQITRRFYGGLTDVGPAGTRNGFYFPVLMLASPDNITDPDLIFEGQSLKIPDLKRNLANSVSRQAIKESLINAANVYNRKGKPEEEEGLRRLANSL